MSGSLANELFDREAPGTFAEGLLLKSAPDLTGAKDDPGVGYWHCDLEDHDRLTWSKKVYELFGLPAGTPIGRERAAAHYSEVSKCVLKRVRTYALNRRLGFILDAEIRPETGGNRWIRVLAVPILADRRVVGLHGLKRAL